MNYITRERVQVDRIATAGAVRKFIDPDATFQVVLAMAATPTRNA
jgi:hypothetical protein